MSARSAALSTRARTALAMLIALVLLPIGMASSQAAVLSGVIKDVQVTRDSTSLYATLKTTMSWCLPSAAKPGDTFTLTLPAEMTSFPAGFPLKDPSGAVVATAAISTTKPAAATFTLTNYVATHRNVCGSAWFESRWDRNVVTVGDGPTVRYTASGGQTWTKDLPIAAAVRIDRTKARKWGAFTQGDQCRTIGADCLSWGIESPAGPFDSFTVNDTATSGQQFICSFLRVGISEVDATGHLAHEVNYTGPVTKTCSSTAFSVTTGPAPAGKVLTVHIHSTVTNPAAAGGVTYRNVATTTTVRDAGNQVTIVETAQRSGTAGGDGVGDAISIVKGDSAGNPADVEGDAVSLPTGSTGLVFVIRNTGASTLTDVAVSDAVIANGAVTGLSCDFTKLGGPATGTRWAGPFRPGASFQCTATLSGVVAGAAHQDTATVTAKSANGTVTDSNDYWATTPPAPQPTKPAISIVKGDVAGNPADTPATAVVLDKDSSSVGVVYVIKNTGDEPLKSVTVSDQVIANGVVSGLTCDFSPLGGPATGVTWAAGPLKPGASFTCTATVTGIQAGDVIHKNIGKVSGVGITSGTTVTSENPYHAIRPKVEGITFEEPPVVPPTAQPPTTPQAPTESGQVMGAVLATTGADPKPMLAFGVGLLLVGVGLVASTRRRAPACVPRGKM